MPQPINFEWDNANKEKSWRKHKVSIKECEQAFLDEKRQSWKDFPHSKHEPRYILLGATEDKRILFIVFTIRAAWLRVISARDASKKERKIYL